jgi:hypothetical protein
MPLRQPLACSGKHRKNIVSLFLAKRLARKRSLNFGCLIDQRPSNCSHRRCVDFLGSEQDCLRQLRHETHAVYPDGRGIKCPNISCEMVLIDRNAWKIMFPGTPDGSVEYIPESIILKILRCTLGMLSIYNRPASSSYAMIKNKHGWNFVLWWEILTLNAVENLPILLKI